MMNLMADAIHDNPKKILGKCANPRCGKDVIGRGVLHKRIPLPLEGGNSSVILEKFYHDACSPAVPAVAQELPGS